jgi:dTDP-4-dehydrorhamnose 3,5-epimerase-like enzyme
MQKLLPYELVQDERGAFLGITRENWAEINFIETRADQIRGGHYHKETRELFLIISGEIDVVVDNIKSGEHIEFAANKGDIFVVEPYELHTFYTRAGAKWINMLSQVLDSQKPDFHRVEKTI